MKATIDRPATLAAQIRTNQASFCQSGRAGRPSSSVIAGLVNLAAKHPVSPSGIAQNYRHKDYRAYQHE